MKIIAVCNQKGGVAKTTTAVNVAAYLGILKKKTLLIDLDPQGNSTMSCGIDKNSVTNTILDVCVENKSLSDVIIKTEFKNLSIVPTNQDLTVAEVEMQKLNNAPFILKNSFEHLANNKKNNSFDYVIIDCPPALSILTVNALTASNSVIVPIQCEYYALEGLSSLLSTIEGLQKTINKDLEILGFLRTMFDSRAKLASEVSTQIETFLKEKVFKTIIPRNIRLAEAPSFGMPAHYYEKKAKGSIAYLELTKEILKKSR